MKDHEHSSLDAMSQCDNRPHVESQDYSSDVITMVDTERTVTMDNECHTDERAPNILDITDNQRPQARRIKIKPEPLGTETNATTWGEAWRSDSIADGPRAGCGPGEALGGRVTNRPSVCHQTPAARRQEVEAQRDVSVLPTSGERDTSRISASQLHNYQDTLDFGRPAAVHPSGADSRKPIDAVSGLNTAAAEATGSNVTIPVNKRSYLKVVLSMAAEDTRAGASRGCHVHRPSSAVTPGEIPRKWSEVPGGAEAPGGAECGSAPTTESQASASPEEEEDDSSSGDEIEELRRLASRLKLSTRRPSVQAWQAQNFHDDKPVVKRSFVASKPAFESVPEDETVVVKDTWSRDTKDRIDQALSRARRDLLAMRAQDASLARQFISLRQDIQRLRLERSTAAHRQVLEDAIDEEDDRDQQAHCDSPPDQFSPMLKHYGVTRMNLATRRFSVF